MVWWALAKLVIFAAISFLLAPKPQDAKPVGLDEFDIPTPDPSKPIPIVFGTVWIKSADVAWYGDLRTEKIYGDGGKG